MGSRRGRWGGAMRKVGHASCDILRQNAVHGVCAGTSCRYIWLPMWVLDVTHGEQEGPLGGAMRKVGHTFVTSYAKMRCMVSVRYIWLPMWVLDIPHGEPEGPLVGAMKAQERSAHAQPLPQHAARRRLT